MERVKPSRSCASPQKFFLESDRKIEKFNIPLTNFDFIKLHSMFMQLTSSRFETSDVIKGRIIIHKILNSLKYYHYVGCLSLVRPIPSESIDIFQIIQKHAQVYGLQHAINQFFIEYTQLDFVWIELTEGLIRQLGQSNIDYFIKIMTQHEAMPLIIIQYNS